MQGLHFLNRQHYAGTNASNHSLHYALSTALAERRTDVLRHLTQRHDSAQMAQALICLNARQRADLLSLLHPQQRRSIHAALPRHAQKQWHLTQRCEQPARCPLFQRFLRLSQQWRHPLSWLRPRLTQHADN